MKALLDRRPGVKAREAMQAAFEGSRLEDPSAFADLAKKKLSSTTLHKHVELTESGKSAIALALSTLEGKLLFPDQGIWKGTIDTCRSIGLNFSLLPTDLGLIKSKTLSDALIREQPKALFITTYAGYIAEQNLREISSICKAQGTLIIHDASDSIGDKSIPKQLKADITVGSAREPKLLNLSKGGFITTDSAGLAASIKKANKSSFDPVTCAGIAEELKEAPATLKKLLQISGEIRDTLSMAVHRDRRGPCVGVFHDSPKKIIDRARRDSIFTKKGRSLFSSCPRYDRFLEKGFVFELKKLDVGCMESTEFEHITQWIQSSTGG